MVAGQLSTTAKHVVSRSILAADESTGTIKKRLASIGLDSTPEINRSYRQLLFTAPGIEKFVSGVILFEETLGQSSDDGTPFHKLLEDKDIAPGIKVDQGTEELSEQAPDTYTKGLEGLGDRLKTYGQKGAKFAKWRAVYKISEDGNHPSLAAIEKNANDLAEYAKACQENGIVPIVEPEVLMDGSHTIDICEKITEQVLSEVFTKLREKDVLLSGIILKPNMVTSGNTADTQADVSTVAKKTLEVLKKTVSPEVAGIAFLSGGQNPDLATSHLNEINKMKNQKLTEYPWRITASFGRALQDEALKTWMGKKENITAAQNAFIKRAEQVFKASNGQL